MERELPKKPVAKQVPSDEALRAIIEMAAAVQAGGLAATAAWAAPGNRQMAYDACHEAAEWAYEALKARGVK